MKTTILTVFFFFLGMIARTQPLADSSQARPLNGVSVNLLGEATLIGFNYERYTFLGPNIFITAKIGLGYNTETPSFGCLSPPCAELPPPVNYFTIPHFISVNLGGKKSFMEIGLGAAFAGKHYLPYAIYGYRALPLKSHQFFFRLFIHRKLSNYYPDIIFIPFGVSLGGVF